MVARGPADRWKGYAESLYQEFGGHGGLQNLCFGSGSGVIIHVQW